MRKTLIIVFILSILLCCSNAFAETNSLITFQGIQWLSNVETCLKTLVDKGFIQDSIIGFTDEEGAYIAQDETGFIWPNHDKDFEKVSMKISLHGIVKSRIGGYAVDDIVLFFAYDGIETKLITVEVSLFNPTFDDIKGKVDKIYGGGEVTYSDDIIDSIIWKGQDSSCILLYSEGKGSNIWLGYGRLDAEKILAESKEVVLQPVSAEDVSGL